MLAFSARAELADYIQHLELTSLVRGAFFRSVTIPGGTVLSRRPPRETRPALDAIAASAPRDAALFAIRAREAELALDFPAAEADWKRHAELHPDPAAGRLALADYYHRRLQPVEELNALTAAAKAPSPASDLLLPASDQRAWRSFERALTLIDAQALPAGRAMEQYRAWIDRYPAEPAVYSRFFDDALRRREYAAAESAVALRRKAFPIDEVFPVRARASLAVRQGGTAAALKVYEESFRPLWPTGLVKNYFELLGQSRGLRRYLDAARSAAAANPDDVIPAARIFYYHQQQGNLEAARRALDDYRRRKEARNSPWTADELLTLAKLHEGAHGYDEAARHYYALYSLPAAPGAAREEALAGIANLLLSAPEQPIRFGMGDLSFYKDVAAMDPYPGFLNGVLSLLLNSSQPEWRYSMQQQTSVAYFHRARAGELLALFDSRFPKSARRAGLHAKLLDAYAIYGDNDAVIHAGARFLTAFPNAAERTHVSLLMAGAHARKKQAPEEFAVYEALLKELSQRAGGVPLGASARPPQPPAADPNQPYARPPAPSAAMSVSTAGARSPDYARVLDRYISRLVSMKRVRDALALYRRELDRNPSDPGLYERLAAFLDQNRLAAEIEQVYRLAMAQFPGGSWHQKLARWYLRQKRAAEFEKLTAGVVQTFAGTELERYFREVVNQGAVDPLLYRQVNLYAHQRFPHNLTFVRNLLSAYRAKGTADPSAWENLIRNYWFYDDGLRARYFEFLSRNNRLDTEIQALYASPAKSAAALQFLAEGEAWRSHFEAAAAPMRALAADFPGSPEIAQRAAALHRSLASADTAVSILDGLSQTQPRDTITLARMGEIYADREMFDKARPLWNRIAAIQPGRPEGYIEAATVFWDYYQFDDALRLIQEGRVKLNNPALYSYEAGAIHENRRDYTHAIEEYINGALGSEGGSAAQSRLLVLARRPAHRDLAGRLTAQRAAARPDGAAVTLHVAVLEAQNRRNDLEAFLLSLSGSAASHELLARIRSVAVRQGFPAVEERALLREIDITTDSVDRMRARLALVRFHEGRQDLAAARRHMDALYGDHPAVLGIVRAAAGFHWRNKDAGRALEVLEQAAARAHPALSRQLAFEAAGKAAESGRFAEARKLLDVLLRDQPFHAEYLATMAGTYAREGDQRALRAFYQEKIQALRAAPLAEAEKTSQIAALRRGLIPALTRMDDHAGAIDQYVEIINRFPEDEPLVREAAAYASAHNRRQQLQDYYTRSAAASPRDYRWPMVLARIETHFENFPAAIAAYERAVAVRPDRTDLYTARASLEERLMRFPDAVRSYAKIYELTYRDPQWMGKVAELHMRQGQPAEAVKALEKALIEGRPPRPGAYFEAARKLESWNLLHQARRYAEEAMNLASPQDFGGIAVYTRVMTRLRLHEAAWNRAAPAGAYALQEIGNAVRQYYTPEEKVLFEAFLQKVNLPADAVAQAAQNAGLAGFEARSRHAVLMSRPGRPENHWHQQRLIQLQQRRMRFDELGLQLEEYWKVHPPADPRDSLLDLAAQAYRSAGNSAAELRALRLRNNLPGNLQQRLFELMLIQQPDQIMQRAALSNSAAAFLVGRGDPALARRSIEARAALQPPVWGRAYAGLVGLHYADPAPQVRRAFEEALGVAAISDRLGTPADRNQQIAGDTWFYYGSRYGEYLAAMGDARAADYLPAMVENRPGSAEAYFTLAEYYGERGDAARALAEYEHALQVDPLRGAAHDRAAVLLWDRGGRGEAVARWRAALEAFAHQQDRGRVPAVFWEEVRSALENIGRRRTLAPVRPEADRLLRTYIRRNGPYRVSPLLEGALAAAADPAAGIAWIADLGRAAPDPAAFLGSIVDAPWIPAGHRDEIYRALIASAEANAAQAHGEARGFALSNLWRWQVRHAAWLMDTSQAQRAQAALNALPAEARHQLMGEIVPLEIRLAARNNSLAALLRRWRTQPGHPPQSYLLQRAAAELRAAGDAANAATVLEFVYTRELDRGNFNPTNFLGLAEVKLQQGDPQAALALLRRMTLVAGEPFENLESAAALLEKAGRPADALEFLETRAKSVPWDDAARLRLAEALLRANRGRDRAAGELRNIAASREASYRMRASAAKALGEARLPAAGATGSAELDLLASGTAIDPAAAERPYFLEARIAAAARTSGPAARVRLLRGALETEPNADTHRLALFQAAREAGDHLAAVSALEPLLESGGLRYALQGTGAPVEEEVQAAATYRNYAGQFLAAAGLDSGRRAEAALALSDSLARLDRLRPATVAARIAVELQPSAAARAHLAQVSAESARQAQNARRVPEISNNLEQPRLVRPRVAAPAVSQSSGGTAQ